MRRWALLLLAVGCVDETSAPPPRDGGPTVTARDGGERAPPEFEPILTGARTDLDHFETFDLTDPTRRTRLLPARSFDYGLKRGNFARLALTPDRRTMIYTHTRGEVRRFVAIDVTAPHASPTVLMHDSGEGKLAAVSNTLLVTRRSAGVAIASLDGSTPAVVAFADTLVGPAAIAGDYVVAEDAYGVRPLRTYHVPTGVTEVLYEPSNEGNATLEGVVGTNVLAQVGSTLVRVDVTTHEHQVIAEDCREYLGHTDDEAEVFCDRRGWTVAYRTDGSNALDPRRLFSTFRPYLSADGNWAWWHGDRALHSGSTRDGTVTATVPTGDFSSIRFVSSDGSLAFVLTAEGRLLVDRYGAVVSTLAHDPIEVDPTYRFVHVEDGGLLDLETNTLTEIDGDWTFTPTGAVAYTRAEGLRLSRATGRERTTVMSDWFTPHRTLVAPDEDGVVTDRGADGVWWTPRQGGDSVLVSERGGTAHMQTCGGYLVANWPDEDATHAFALDGRDAAGADEVWEDLPPNQVIAPPVVFGMGRRHIVAVDVDGRADTPRIVFTSDTHDVSHAKWSDATNQLVFVLTSPGERVIAGVTPDGTLTSYATFDASQALEVELFGAEAWVMFGGGSPVRVALDSIRAPQIVGAAGRVLAVFEDQRHALLEDQGAAAIVHLDTGERTPLADSGFYYRFANRAGDGFAYQVSDVSFVLRSFDPLEVVTIAQDATPWTFDVEDRALFHVAERARRLYRYDFDLAWSQVLTERDRPIAALHVGAAPYPIVRTHVHGDYGVFALLRDGRVEAIDDETDADDFVFELGAIAP
ncbi:MAG: hypothetical protein RIT81_07575 [Deltaproteobacteria bacterium]